MFTQQPRPYFMDIDYSKMKVNDYLYLAGISRDDVDLVRAKAAGYGVILSFTNTLDGYEFWCEQILPSKNDTNEIKIMKILSKHVHNGLSRTGLHKKMGGVPAAEIETAIQALVSKKMVYLVDAYTKGRMKQIVFPYDQRYDKF